MLKVTRNGEDITHLTTSGKVRNLAAAGARVAEAITHSRRVFQEPEEVNRRLEICHACEFYTGTTCMKCGCAVRFKAALATEHCPINKW